MTKVIDSTPQEGNLVKVVTPKMLTLTKKPANSTAFKVVRSDTTEGETQMTTKNPVARRVRRSDTTNPIMRLTFPKDFTTDDIAGTLTQFGMENYTISKGDDGLMMATRSDLQSIANDATTTIKLDSRGVMATVARSDSATSGYLSIKAVAFEFDPEKHDEESIAEWLKRNSVDIPVPAIENPDAAVVVKRSDVAEGVEVRRLDLGEGVTVVIVQSDEMDVPDPLAEAVSDSAYGNWGWGFLDFNMSMADAEFCDAMDDANYRLQSVLRNIMFYSNLPIDVRKTLVQSSLQQYETFVIGIMDSLPRQVLTAVARSAPHQQESNMSNDKAAAAAAPAAAAPAETDTITISRADLTKLVEEQVAAALAKAPAATETQRSDTAATAAPAAETPAAAPAAAADANAALVETIRSAFAAEVKPLAERLEKLEGQTVVRSNTDDPVQVERSDKKDIPRNPDGTPNINEVFRGAIPGLRGRRAAASE